MRTITLEAFAIRPRATALSSEYLNAEEIVNF